MQASLDAASLKHVTKAIACLSRFGDDMVLYATRYHLILSGTNSSLSAYCRFKYHKQFFSRFVVQDDPNWDMKDDGIRVSGQLLVKSLLAILRPVIVGKSLERCEFTLVEGGAAQQFDEEEGDSLESKLIVRLHCKHGVVKTHRLLLNEAMNLMTPGSSNPPQESKLTIGARSLKDLLDHFPIAKGPKSDPQIILTFGADEVILKAQESSLDTSVKGQLATELSITSAEFELYDVYNPPFTVGLHLKELMATLAFAEAYKLDLRFTEPAAPLFIEIEGDLSETLFVISTNQVREEDFPVGVPPPRAPSVVPRGHKREHDDQDDHARLATPGSARRRPQKAVVRADRESVARDLASQSSRGSVARMMPPPSLPAHRAPPGPIPPSPNPFAPPPPNAFAAPSPHASNPFAPSQERARDPLFSQEPLFLPGSQVPLSQSAAAAIRESGLGIEDMDEAEFAAMLEDEGEEVNFAPSQPPASQAGGASAGSAEDEERDELDEDEVMRESSFDLYEDSHTEFAPTQGDVSAKTFRPLFDD